MTTLDPQTENNVFHSSNFSCDYCNFTFKTEKLLKLHQWRVHDYNSHNECDRCDTFFKKIGQLRRFHWEYDVPTNKKIFPCDYCHSVFNKKKELQKHLLYIHNKNKKPECSKCNFQTKYPSKLHIHLSRRHDIGEYKCETCFRNVFKVIPFQSNQTQNKKIKICQKCYDKFLGHPGKLEKDMVNYLKRESLIKPYVVLKDSIIKGAACLTRRRPDLYIASTNKLHLIVECDEHEHRNYPRRCERGRIDEILDEIPEGRVVFIRWNPHKAQKYQNGHLIKIKIDIETRLLNLKKFILHLINRREDQWPKDQNYLIYYMYYSEYRKDLISEYFYRHVYDVNDFEEPNEHTPSNSNGNSIGKLFLSIKKTYEDDNSIENAPSPVLWLYKLIKNGKYDKLLRNKNNTDVVHTNYTEWCRKNDKKIFNRPHWAVSINTCKKDGRVLNRIEERFRVWDEKKQKVVRKCIRPIFAIPEKECIELIEKKYTKCQF